MKNSLDYCNGGSQNQRPLISTTLNINQNLARITVEDCVTVVPNPFELCLVASNRAKSILSGAATELDRKEKPAVIALREIGDHMLNVDAIKQNILSSIMNRGALENTRVDSATQAEIIEEVQGQMLKEATFVGENLQVDD